MAAMSKTKCHSQVPQCCGKRQPVYQSSPNRVCLGISDIGNIPILHTEGVGQY